VLRQGKVKKKKKKKHLWKHLLVCDLLVQAPDRNKSIRIEQQKVELGDADGQRDLFFAAA